MKLPLKHIVTLVITALVCIFAYQAYWLTGLYKSQCASMDGKIHEMMETSHFEEMRTRIERLHRGNNHEKEITASTPYTYHEGKSQRQLDTLKIDEKSQRKYVGKEKNTQQETLRLMISGKLTTLMQQALFSKLNDLTQPDIQVYDSALKARMLSDCLLLAHDGNPVPHQVRFMKGRIVLTQVTSPRGYVPSSDAKHYKYVVYNEGETNEEKYVLVIEPVTTAVLGQMTGILATSLFIMLILGFVFWYLIHTMLKQKTLDEMKSDFTNNITHELKTPIAVAYAANDALLNYGMLSRPDKAKNYLSIAQEQLQRLSGMVEQILAMSMERRKTMRLNFMDVQIRKIIEPLMVQHQLKADKKVEFSLSVEPDDLTARADRMHLSNILSNLIDNAIKYSGDSVRISISASISDEADVRGKAYGRAVALSVEDDGIGIAHDKLAYVFDKFYRVTDGNKYTIKGYGLGLFYVKSLMEKMGGSVSVKSEIGKGSCFTLLFPC